MAGTPACRQQKWAQLTAPKDTGPYLLEGWAVTLRVSESAILRGGAWSKSSRQSLRGEDVPQDLDIRVPGESAQAWVLCLRLSQRSLGQAANTEQGRFPKGKLGCPSIKRGEESSAGKEKKTKVYSLTLPSFLRKQG